MGGWLGGIRGVTFSFLSIVPFSCAKPGGVT